MWSKQNNDGKYVIEEAKLSNINLTCHFAMGILFYFFYYSYI